jgi:uncharacterized protein YbjT (DUF2867 family)
MAKKNQKTILVAAATGEPGTSVVRHLRQKGFPVRALVRELNRPEAQALVGRGTEVVSGSLDDPASLARALDGIYGVYCVQPPIEDGVGAEIVEGMNLLDAARRSGITHLVYNSVGSANRNTGIPHFESKFRIEEHLRATGLPHTVLRPVFFMEYWLRRDMREGIEQGVLRLPLEPETRLQMISVDDLAIFVTMAFEHPGHWQDRAVDLAGDEMSMQEIANALGRKTGRHVQYGQIPWDDFEHQVGHAEKLMYRWLQDVGFQVDIAGLRQEHPNMMSFESWLNVNWRPRWQTA